MIRRNRSRLAPYEVKGFFGFVVRSSDFDGIASNSSVRKASALYLRTVQTRRSMEGYVEPVHNTSLGLPLRATTFSHLVNALKYLEKAKKKEERLHYVLLLCKDNHSSTVHSESLEHLPILGYWMREAPDMIRTHLAMQVEIDARRSRNGTQRTLSLQQNCVAIRYVQKAIVSNIPRKSKALPLEHGGTRPTLLSARQRDLLSKEAPWWPYEKVGWYSFTKPNANMQREAAEVLRLCMANMNEAHYQFALALSVGEGNDHVSLFMQEHWRK